MSSTAAAAPAASVAIVIIDNSYIFSNPLRFYSLRYSFKNCPTGCKCVPKEAPVAASSSVDDPFAGDSSGEEVAQCEEDKPCEDDGSGD